MHLSSHCSPTSAFSTILLPLRHHRPPLNRPLAKLQHSRLRRCRGWVDLWPGALWGFGKLSSLTCLPCSALKTGGEEILRERWDEANRGDDDPDVNMDVDPVTPRHSQAQTRTGPILPDWSRSPLPAGAPSATTVPNTPLITVN